MKLEIKKDLVKAILYYLHNAQTNYLTYLKKDIKDYIYSDEQYLLLLPDKDLMSIALTLLLRRT